MIFLAEKFVLSKNIRIFAATESATLPIWTANQGGSFAFSVGTPKERSTIQKGALKDSDTIQKSDSTIQKSDSTTQKSDSTTQKRESATQKRESATQKRESATQKDSLKDSNTIPKTDVTTQKDHLKDSNTILKALEHIQAEVLRYIMAHPQTTREEIADSIDGISFGGVKFIIAKLQKKGLLKRVGGRKHGEWQVL